MRTRKFERFWASTGLVLGTMLIVSCGSIGPGDSGAGDSAGEPNDSTTPEEEPDDSTADSNEPTPPEAPVDETVYLCANHEVPAHMIDNPKQASELDENGQTALDEATYGGHEPLALEDLENWTVIVETDDEISIIRTAGPDSEMFDDRVRNDYELVTVQNDADTGWTVKANSNCALTVDLGDLDVLSIQLDPDSPPDPDSRELDLLVMDQACGGDSDMPERVEIVEINETDTEINLLIGVEPLPSDVAYTCEGFPPTPYTIELDAPLGDRVIVDTSRVDRRELTL